MIPSKVHYVGVWHWDAFFHAIAYSYVDHRLAADQLRIVLDHQLPDGMIPDCVHDEGVVDYLVTPCEGPVTKPPVMAWAALKLYEAIGDLDFLAEIYEPLTRWNQWWLHNNDDDQDGLAQYNHPFSSGMDDSPVWDEGMPVVSPDLNTYLCIQMESLSRIARVIGEDREAEFWLERSRQMTGRMVDRLWDDKAGLFRPRRMIDGRLAAPVASLTPISLFPLWTGQLSGDMAGRLVGHLTNPAEFWTKYPVPTVAKCDPAYDASQMWRGPTWININYILVEALERSGFYSLALELATRTINLVNGGADIAEYYDPETGEKPPRAAPMFGWSAALFIDLVIRYAARTPRMASG